MQETQKENPKFKKLFRKIQRDWETFNGNQKTDFRSEEPNLHSKSPMHVWFFSEKKEKERNNNYKENF